MNWIDFQPCSIRSILNELGEPFTFRQMIGDIIIFLTNPNYHMVSNVTSGE